MLQYLHYWTTKQRRTKFSNVREFYCLEGFGIVGAQWTPALVLSVSFFSLRWILRHRFLILGPVSFGKIWCNSSSSLTISLVYSKAMFNTSDSPMVASMNLTSSSKFKGRLKSGFVQNSFMGSSNSNVPVRFSVESVGRTFLRALIVDLPSIRSIPSLSTGESSEGTALLVDTSGY